MPLFTSPRPAVRPVIPTSADVESEGPNTDRQKEPQIQLVNTQSVKSNTSRAAKSKSVIQKRQQSMLKLSINSYLKQKDNVALHRQKSSSFMQKTTEFKSMQKKKLEAKANQSIVKSEQNASILIQPDKSGQPQVQEVLCIDNPEIRVQEPLRTVKANQTIMIDFTGTFNDQTQDELQTTPQPRTDHHHRTSLTVPTQYEGLKSNLSGNDNSSSLYLTSTEQNPRPMGQNIDGASLCQSQVRESPCLQSDLEERKDMINTQGEGSFLQQQLSDSQDISGLRLKQLQKTDESIAGFNISEQINQATVSASFEGHHHRMGLIEILGVDDTDKSQLVDSVLITLSKKLEQSGQVVDDDNELVFWMDYVDDAITFLQDQLEGATNARLMLKVLDICGRIIRGHGDLVSIQLKGVLVDSLLAVLREDQIQNVPALSFAWIIQRARPNNLAWFFYIETMRSLQEQGEADETLMIKCLSVVEALIKDLIRKVEV